MTGDGREILEIRPSVVGMTVVVCCRACARRFESYQGTIGGLAVGVHCCPRCGACHAATPDAFETALDRLLPAPGVQEMRELTTEATRIAEGWHRVEALVGVLQYRGVPLGPATERGLLSFISAGLAASTRRAE